MQTEALPYLESLRPFKEKIRCRSAPFNRMFAAATRSMVSARE